MALPLPGQHVGGLEAKDLVGLSEPEYRAVMAERLDAIQANFEKVALQYPLGPQYQAYPVSTSLPTTPVDGMVVDYVADATAGVVWRFKYRAASASTYKWECVGASYGLEGISAATLQTTTSTSYVDLATAGPAVTVPLAGDYMVCTSVAGYNTTAGQTVYMSYAIGATGAVDADAVGFAVAAASTDIHYVTQNKRKIFATAATVLTTKYRTSGGTATFRGTDSVWGLSRRIAITPIRVI